MAGRPRSPQQERFFDELKVWSAIKLRILVKYFDAYLRIRGGTQSTMYYVDGFAGTGSYGDDQSSNSEEGSPVLIAKLAQQIVESGKPYRLICLNTEINPDWFAKLQKRLAIFDTDLVQSRLGSFEQHLPAILSTVGQAPALFFLDPFGVSPIKLSSLKALLRRPDTELLLNFSTPSLRRLGGFEDSAASSQRTAKMRLVSEVLGENSDDSDPEWLQEWRRLNDPAAWDTWAINTYMQRILSASSQNQFCVAYPIREEYRSRPKYFLIFSTRSDKAMAVMNDVLCTEEDDLFIKSEAFSSNGQMTLYPLIRDAERENRIAGLLDEIYVYGLKHQGCNRDRLTRDLILENFGQLKKKHYRQAVERLVELRKATYSKKRPNDFDPITFV